MKKQNIVNLVKYHMNNDEGSFRNEVYEIAKDFNESGDTAIAQYLLALIKDIDFFKTQDYDYSSFKFLYKDSKPCSSLLFPDVLTQDIVSVARTINKKNGLRRFLFVGAPGTGKTEACRHIARLTNRSLLVVKTEELVDSHLGQTPKNIIELFKEISRVLYEGTIVLFDELDSLVLDRINDHDLREMGRATSTFLKQLDLLDDDIVLIATTNLSKNIDKAISRRFGATISFDRYNETDLFEIAESYLHELQENGSILKREPKILKKIINNCKPLPNPGDLKNALLLSVSFSEDNEYGYLRKLMNTLFPKVHLDDVNSLKGMGFTFRDIEILSHYSKSTASRIFLGGNKNGK